MNLGDEFKSLPPVLIVISCVILSKQLLGSLFANEFSLVHSRHAVNNC